jgi:hypothetical protein
VKTGSINSGTVVEYNKEALTVAFIQFLFYCELAHSFREDMVNAPISYRNSAVKMSQNIHLLIHCNLGNIH